MGFELGERRLHVDARSDISGDIVDAERFLGGEEGRLDGAYGIGKLPHQAALT
jgi:hypothetical protein